MTEDSKAQERYAREDEEQQMSNENETQTEVAVTCPRCDGCGQLANSDDREPWSVWLALPLQSALAVTMGLVKPEPCYECGGTGKATTQPAGEHHTGTLDLTGEGNAPEPITVTGPDADLVRALLADPHRNDHILQIDNTGWTLQHPVIERCTGELFDCHLGQEEDQLSALWDTHYPGRYVAWLTEGVIWTEPIAEARS